MSALLSSPCFTGYAPPDPAAERADAARVAADLGERYEVTGFLNKGGFATVWQAHDRVAGLPVAVKRLNAATRRPGDFFRELRVMFRLDHPHVVRLVNFLEAGGTRYLILELCHGGSLRAAVSRAHRRGIACPEGRAAAIVRQVAGGLAAAHREGFAHRDIKPENVLFARAAAEPFGGTGPAKLADFGLARLLRGEDDEDFGLRAATGSPAYMAPEQFHGAFEPASDVYALGVLAYELLHGGPPFAGTPQELARQHLHEPPPWPRELPEPWRGLLPRMLAKAPADRPTAAEVEAALPAERKPVRVTHDGATVTVWDGTAQRWARPVDAGGLKPLAARATDGAVAAVEFAGGPGLRFLAACGRDLGAVPLPGLCWQLKAAGPGAFAARLLTGHGFVAYLCGPGGCRPLAGSQGVSDLRAGPRGVAGRWPDGTVKRWPRPPHGSDDR